MDIQTPKVRKVTKSMDVAGMVMLVIAALSRGASSWFVDPLLKGLFLGAFFPVLVASAVMFISARIVDITVLLLAQPADPRSSMRALGDETRPLRKSDLRPVKPDANNGAMDNPA